ncbi:hypothetical protein [Aureimonas frigidaquae]|uniref:Uncharacterized protein n=1 Tax=Aureimonas frigidaquae TaxID=424757 RepID=A0A0P0YZP4_9HYPH|nr:hypothetical protein [Aureimonas frigidaquae]BAT27171.1 hypothetical protein [Aureimonas frigidaquae]
MAQEHPSPDDKVKPDTASDGQTPHEGDTPPAAGPHAKPELTNPDATPGSGALPPVEGDEESDMGSTG